MMPPALPVLMLAATCGLTSRVIAPRARAPGSELAGVQAFTAELAAHLFDSAHPPIPLAKADVFITQIEWRQAQDASARQQEPQREPRAGSSVNQSGAGTLLPLNIAMMFPASGREDYDIALNVTQRTIRGSGVGTYDRQGRLSGHTYETLEDARALRFRAGVGVALPLAGVLGLAAAQGVAMNTAQSTTGMTGARSGDSPDERAHATEARMTDDERFSLLISVLGNATAC